MSLPVEYASLPPPSVIEELVYTVLRDELIAATEAAFAARGVAYNVGQLETDPVVIQAEVYANREQRLRQRVNEAIRAYMVPFSTNADLDMLASFYDTFRLEGETDAQLRYRTIEGIRGRSPAGSKHWYSYNALSASARVRKVSVDLDPLAPRVLISVLSTDNGGVADQPLLDLVSARVNSDAVKVVSDIVVVRPAVFQTAAVTASVHLLEGATDSIFTALPAKLTELWNARQDMGLDLTTSWLISALMQPGVQKVQLTAPAADVVVTHNQAVALGAINLTLVGRGY